MFTRRNLLMLGTFAALGGAGYYMRGGGVGSFEGSTLKPDEAFKAASSGQIKLIDIRRPDEWRRTGWGAPAIPLDMRRKDFIDELDKLVTGDRDQPVALICAGGVRSARLSRRLNEAGFTNIIDIPEGMLGSKAGPGWLRRGLPVVKQQ